MPFTHRYAALKDHVVTIIDYPVQYRFCDSTVLVITTVAVDAEIPVIRIILSAEDDGTFLITSIDQFMQIKGLLFRKWTKQPFIYDQQILLRIESLDAVLSIRRLR